MNLFVMSLHYQQLIQALSCNDQHYTCVYKPVIEKFTTTLPTHRSWTIKTRSSAVSRRMTERRTTAWKCQWRGRWDRMHGKKIANVTITSHLYPHVKSWLSSNTEIYGVNLKTAANRKVHLICQSVDPSTCYKYQLLVTFIIESSSVMM